MKKLLPVLLLMMCIAVGFAQTPTKAKAAPDTGFMSWVHDAWNTVKEKGKPAAEQFVRQWPKRFTDVKKKVADLNFKVRTGLVALDLEQKRNLAIELWRMRKSLDLLTLLRPDVLQSLTGWIHPD